MSTGPTVTAAPASDGQPVEVRVNTKLAVPALTPVTTPPLVTVATALLVLDHVPPEEGESVVIPPIQIKLAPVTPMVGLPLIVTAFEASEVHPVDVLVNVNVVDPAATPVTTPPLVMVATDGLLLVQVPPIEGDKVVVAPIHKADAPVIETEGLT